MANSAAVEEEAGEDGSVEQGEFDFADLDARRLQQLVEAGVAVFADADECPGAVGVVVGLSGDGQCRGPHGRDADAGAQAFEPGGGHVTYVVARLRVRCTRGLPGVG
ncbi:hypothetical protein [Streptomyces phaeochromogenes]|uniref:hypothetical protein n=1 Tax=Streptomyces phaeochromogenes TaxID=1923 RepID=UPI003870D54F|nr:hypothetical protein OHB08_49680 [Streptomyces phaeochromogenes]